MVGIGSELQRKAGPLPVWAWAGLGTVTLAGVLIGKKKQSMDQAVAGSTDNTSTVIGGPSTLIPTAAPMPFTGGDTFVNTTINNIPPGGTTKTGKPGPTGSTGKTGLPAVNPSASPAKISKTSATGKTMIKLGCFDKAGHYAGHQVSGGVPVYGLIGLWFMQGASVRAHKAHCIYIPAKFKAYIV
jgi:hypothetical protein